MKKRKDLQKITKINEEEIQDTMKNKFKGSKQKKRAFNLKLKHKMQKN